MAWTFGFCDLAGVPIGEITEAYERKLTLPLNGLPTASVRLNLTDPLADEVLSRSGDVLLKVYQDMTLRFIGDLMTAEEVSRAEETKPPSLVLNFAGPLWRLSKKLIGSSPPGSTSYFENLATDQIIKGILDQANFDDTSVSPAINRDTGIRWNVSNPSLYTATVGLEPSWAMKPVSEAITELQQAQVAFPVTAPPYYDAQDDFTSAGDGPLHTRLATDGTAWDTNDTGTTDFDVYSAGDYAHRAAAGDPSYTGGKWAVSGTGNHGAVMVGVDYQIGTASYTSGYVYFAGVFARYTDQDHWLLAFLDLQANQVALRKKNGAGTDAAWKSYSFATGGVVHSTRYAIRLYVDDTGAYAVWHYSPGYDPGAPVIEGRDPVLASTGALATGKVGFYDALTSGVGFDRNYYTFFAADDPLPQSFEFEVAPSEPTTDADGVKVGTLNIASQIGTSKPEAIFEYGTGGRTAKQYRRLIDRQGLVNHAYVLEPAGGSDVRGADDPTSITARGEFQEVIPSDFGNSQLRQALADAHVAVRKIPREIITFEPSTNAPTFGTDYIVGDIITGRAIQDGTVRFNGEFRVYGVDVSVDDEGKADIVPMLVPST